MHAKASATNRVSVQSGNQAEGTAASAFNRVLACVDTSTHSYKVVPHAIAIAAALRAPLTLMRVLEVPPTDETPPDPVEWSIRCLEAHRHVEHLAQEQSLELGGAEVTITQGQPAEQISLWPQAHEAAITVVGTNAGRDQAQRQLGDTTHKLIDRASGALLLVPPSAPDRAVRYQRLLVPLDGSCRAESVLPFAIRLAIAEDAELVLAHAVPPPELTEVGPLEAEDVKLQDQVKRRNERVARRYLDRVRTRIAEQGLPVRAAVLRDGDVRSRLTRFAIDEAVDMVILYALGRSGRPDVSCGSVASYLLTHAPMPLLLMLPRAPGPTRHVNHANGTNGRLPRRVAL